MAVLAGRPLVRSPGAVLVLPRSFAARCHSRPRLTTLLLSSPGGHPRCSVSVCSWGQGAGPRSAQPSCSQIRVSRQHHSRSWASSQPQGMFIQQQSLKSPSLSAELPGASALQGSAWRALVPPFPLEVFILGWERSLARLLGEAGRRQGCSGEGCSSAPSWKGSLSFIDACCNLPNPG